MTDYGYVDVGKLADYANNSTVGLTANDIMRFPRADVQPVKRGRWIHDRRTQWKCSNCGNFLDFDGLNCGRGSAFFCPNCGTYMGELNE